MQQMSLFEQKQPAEEQSTQEPQAFSSMVSLLMGNAPAYLPQEPARRMRGWGGKSILDDE